jgi:hypothetical protein
MDTFCGCFVCVLIDDAMYETNSPTSAITSAQQLLHTPMLTPPYGQRGNPSANSIGQGNHSRGYVNMGVFACQNCRRNFAPLVHVQRKIVARLSNAERASLTAAPVAKSQQS